MHEIDAGRAVANPRRTRLGPDWIAQSSDVTGHSQPTPSPAPTAGADGHLSPEMR